VLHAAAADVTFASDKSLLARVLGNMIKNALEATPPEGVVTIGCDADDDNVDFWVHNESAMPREVQLQVFQRSFSTKGQGRGVGTYSIKLLTELYLNGEVSFASTPETGTTFRVSYPRTEKFRD
jgi:signal transduction histidine kinase